jgi:CDP-diacylglycerol--glycerol-3-phosphate 3-phosphatidyltransferase
MGRAERIIALGVGLLFDSALIAVLWVMLVLTLFTAVQRFVKVWQQASVTRPAPAPSRWKARRAARPTERAWSRRQRTSRR